MTAGELRPLRALLPVTTLYGTAPSPPPSPAPSPPPSPAPSPPPLPAYVPAFSATQSNVNLLTVGAVNGVATPGGGLANNFVSAIAPNYATYWAYNIIEAYSGGVVNPEYGSFGAVMIFGGGHAGTNDNTLFAMQFGAAQVQFKRVIDPSPTFDGDVGLTTQQVKDRNAKANYNYTATYGDFPGISRVDEVTASQKVDGKPSAPHSYGVPAMWPSAFSGAACGAFFMAAITAANQDGSIKTGSITSYLTNLADPTTPSNVQAWQRKFTHPTYPNASAEAPATVLTDVAAAPISVVFDPTYNRFWWQSRNSQAPRFAVPTAGSAALWWTQGTGTPLDFSDFTQAGWRILFVPQRSLVLAVYCKSTTGKLGIKWAQNAANPSWVNTGATFTQQVSLDVDWSTGDWCPDSPDGGRLLIYDLQGSKSTMAEIKIPAVLGDPWPVEIVALERAVPTFKTVRSPDNASVFGRTGYNPKTKCVAHHAGETPDGTSLVAMIRPRGV